MQTVAEIISVIGSVFRHTGVFPNFPTCRCRPGPGWLCVWTGAAPDFRFGGVLLVAILRLGRFLPGVDEDRDNTSPCFVDERSFAGLRRGNVAVKIVSDGRFRFLPGRNGSDLQAMVAGNNGWRAGSWTRNDISSSVCAGEWSGVRCPGRGRIAAVGSADTDAARLVSGMDRRPADRVIPRRNRENISE